MTVRANALTSDSSATNGTSFVTAPVAPTTNQLVLLAVACTINVAGALDTPSITGNGLTWQLVKRQDLKVNSSSLFLYRAMGAAPTSDTITISLAATLTTCAWSVVAFDGVDTTGTNGSGAIVQAVGATTADATTVSATLAAASDVGNATYGAFFPRAPVGYIPITTGSGLTNLNYAGEEWANIATGWRADTSTTVSATVASAADYFSAIGVELKAVKPAVTGLTSGGSAVAGTVFTTGSFAVSANSLVLVGISTIASTSTTTAAAVPTGLGMTWVKVAEQAYWPDSGGDNGNVSVYRGMRSSTTTGALTLTAAYSCGSCAWQVCEFPNVVTTGTNGSGAVVQSVTGSTGSATSLNLTLAAFVAYNNASFGVFGSSLPTGSPAFNPNTGFTEIFGTALPYDPPSQDMIWHSGGDVLVVGTSIPTAEVAVIGGIALEIKTIIAPANATLNGVGSTASVGNVLVPGVLALTGVGAVANVGNAVKSIATQSTFRNPYVQPFAASSPWNTPIGSGATYVAANMAIPVDPLSSVNTTWAPFPMVDPEIIGLTPTAPACAVNYNGVAWSGGDRCVAQGGVLQTINVPNGFLVGNSSENGSCAFLKADRRTIQQNQPFTRCVAGASATALVAFPDEDFYGAGIGGSHGGSYLSALGGAIRLGELRPGQSGPAHAIKCAVWEAQFLYHGATLAQCYRWPATTADSAWQNYGSGSNAANNSNPDMVMGALLAIPANVKINTLGLETEPARQLAWTLQNYGAYIDDSGGGPSFSWNLEDGVAGSKAVEFSNDYGFDFLARANSGTPWMRDHVRLMAALRCVSNNSVSNVGGGGTPLQPLAAPFSPEFQAKGAAQATAATSLAVPCPAGLTNGIFMLAILAVSGNVTVTPPAGWNIMSGNATGTAASDTQLRLYWRISASEPGSYTWNTSGTAAINGTIWSVTGVDAVTPVNAGSLSSSIGKLVTAATLSTTATNSLLCVISGGQSALTTATPPTFWTMRNSRVAGSTMQVLTATASLYDAAATGTQTIATNGGTADKWAVQMVALHAGLPTFGGNIAGVGAAIAIGNVKKVQASKIAGNAMSMALGSVQFAQSKALTGVGVAATVYSGNLVGGTHVVSGVAAAVGVGNVVAVYGHATLLSGVSSSVAGGVLGVPRVSALSGVNSDPQLGALTAISGDLPVGIMLSAVQGDSTVGSVRFALQQPIAGVALASDTGVTAQRIIYTVLINGVAVQANTGMPAVSGKAHVATGGVSLSSATGVATTNTWGAVVAGNNGTWRPVIVR